MTKTNHTKITNEELKIIITSLRAYYLSLEERGEKGIEHRVAMYLEDLLGSKLNEHFIIKVE